MPPQDSSGLFPPDAAIFCCCGRKVGKVRERCRKLREMVGRIGGKTAGNGRKWQEIENLKTLREMGGICEKWWEMAGICRKWQESAGNGGKC